MEEPVFKETAEVFGIGAVKGGRFAADNRRTQNNFTPPVFVSWQSRHRPAPTQDISRPILPAIGAVQAATRRRTDHHDRKPSRLRRQASARGGRPGTETAGREAGRNAQGEIDPGLFSSRRQV